MRIHLIAMALDLPGPSTQAPGAVVEVARDLSLREVLQEGARARPEAFVLKYDGTVPTWYPVLVGTNAAFPLFLDEDDPKIPCCIGRGGVVAWRVGPEECTLGEAIETIETGLIAARTDCIGYMLGGGRGNGFTPELMHLWQTFLPWIHDLTSAALGVVLAGFAAVVSRHWREWQQRRANPEELVDLLLAKRWEVAELALRLGISTDEALELLKPIPRGALSEEDGVHLREEFLTILIAHRHIAWYAPFRRDVAIQIIQDNPDLHLNNDLYYIGPD
ncbi:MAG: hypothetical protein ABFE07_19855 [Armatimonadia bacterium]